MNASPDFFGDWLQFQRGLGPLFQSLKEDGHLYLIMEPLFTYGIGLGLLFFVVTLVTREDAARTLALFVILAASILIYPYQHKRAQSIPRPKVSAGWTAESQQLWERQTERVQHFQYFYYVLAVAALLNLMVSSGGLLGKMLAGSLIVWGLLVLVCGIWLHLHEKRIFYHDLRERGVAVRTNASSEVLVQWAEAPRQGAPAARPSS